MGTPLSLIDSPEEVPGSSIDPNFNKGPVIKSEHKKQGKSYECGSCGEILLKDVADSQLKGKAAIKCPKCNKWNETP